MKGYFRYISSTQKHREDIGPLLNRTGKTPTGDAEKEEFLNTFLPLHCVSTGVGGLQILNSIKLL